MKLKDLSPNPQNPRKITDDKLKMLKASLDNFGDLSGIVFNRTSQTLSGGHQRLKCLPPDSEIVITSQYAEKNKQGTVAVGFVFIDGERYSYREVEWDELTEKAANLAANTHGGEWDNKQRIEWLLELEANNYPIEITGLDKEEQEDLMAPFRTMPEGLTDVDEVPEGRATDIKLGDLFELGSHRLLCGDSTDHIQVERLMNGEKADMVFTSPPYNAAKESFLNGRVSGFDNKYKTHADNLGDDDFLGLLSATTTLCLENARYVFVNLGLLAHNRKPLLEYQYAFRDKLKDILIWNKTQCPPNIVKGAFNTRWEYVFCFSDDAKTRGFPCKWQGQYPNVIDGASNSGNEHADDHKAGFPVYFPVWIIEKMDFAESVWDPFCGTGTTLIACEKTNRKCYGMEIDPSYCQVIIDRWEQFTGKKAVKL